ncbi:hypothetical protein JCM10207_004880 [Rhodosporidiobolus poonsookiae]
MTPADVAHRLIPPFLLGTSVNLVLFGINWQQLIAYTQSGETRKIYHAAVLVVFLVDGFHTGISMNTLWTYCVKTWSNPALFEIAPWTFSLYPILTAIVAAVVQLSFTWRIYVLGKRSFYLPIAILILTVVQLVFGFVCSIIAMTNPAWREVNTLQWAVTYHLRKSRTDFNETNSLLEKLIALTIQNNALTTVLALFTFAFFAADNDWHVLFGLAIPKAYLTSLLSSLNMRTTIASDIAATRHKPRQNLDLSAIPLTASTPLQRLESTSAISLRPPSLARSKSTPSVHLMKSNRDFGEESLSVHVLVESVTVEDSVDVSERARDLENRDIETSRSTPPNERFHIAPFLAIPSPHRRG